MIRALRPAIAALAGLFLLLAPAYGLAAKAPPIAERDRIWAQTYSDLVADPAVRYGTLPNGMRYALLRNATPKGEASVRLRFGTGSFEESENQRGLAHYLEHMAFNGSKNVPKGEMVRILERNGLAFGADTNASTSWTETVYRLDLPNTSDTVVDTALMLMRETANELALSQEAMDGERGIVLSEERSRDSPSYRVSMARLGFILKDQLAPNRTPIGTVQVLQTAKRDAIAAYYDAFYRPERATLILVGDFDVDAMEAKVKAKFGDWSARAPKPADTDYGKVAKRGPEVKVMVEPGGSLIMQLSWVQSPQNAADTEAERRREIRERIAFAVVNRRLSRLARADNAPFLSAATGRGDYLRSATVTSLTLTADPSNWRPALIAAEEARRRALEFGVGQDEIDREVLEYRTALKAQLDGAATRRTPSLANQLLEAVDQGGVFTSPAEDLALFERAVQGLTPKEAGDALKDAFKGEGPLLFVATPTPIVGGEPAVAAALKEADSSKLAAGAAQTAKTWTYTSFGTPGAVAERKHVIDLDTHFVRFANNVRLTVKPTKFRDDQVLVLVRFGDGMLGFPKDRTPPWGIGSAFVEGGLADLTAEELEAVLASRIYGSSLNVGEETFSFSGTTKRNDLDTQLQVIAAYMTAPGWRPEGFQRMRTYGLTMHSQLEATPGGVMRRDLSELLHGGDRRWRFPTKDEIANGKPDDVRRALEGALKDAPIEVVIVGDISVERALEAVAATFGALPPRRADAAPPAGGDKIAFPAPASVERTHTGRADQGLAFMAWPTTDFFASPQQAREVRLLERVLNLRLIDQIRIAQGVTYSPSTGFDASTVFPGYGYVSASVEVPPDKIAGFYADVDKIAADLRDKEVSADELERARKPRVESILRSQQSNEYWLGQLAGAQTEPRKLDAIRAATAGLERVTPADVRRAAQTYLVDGKEWRFTVKPK